MFLSHFEIDTHEHAANQHMQLERRVGEELLLSPENGSSISTFLHAHAHTQQRHGLSTNNKKFMEREESDVTELIIQSTGWICQIEVCLRTRGGGHSEPSQEYICKVLDILKYVT